MSFYENTLTLYRDQYPMFGDAEVMPIKVIWDYTYYWGVLCQLVFQDRLTDIALLGALRAELDQAQELNRRMQMFFRAGMRESRGRDDARHARSARSRLVRRDEPRPARRADHRSSSPIACARTSR